jgi:hypothetical protein
MNTARFCQFHDVWGNKWSYLQRRKGNWDNEYCIEFPCLMKSTREHYGLLQILQARLFHSARWSGWLSAPQCSTIMVKFYEKLWLLKKITNYWHLKLFWLIAPKRGWHLCEWGKDRIMKTKNGTYSWSFVPQILRS